MSLLLLILVACTQPHEDFMIGEGREEVVIGQWKSVPDRAELVPTRVEFLRDGTFINYLGGQKRVGFYRFLGYERIQIEVGEEKGTLRIYNVSRDELELMRPNGTILRLRRGF
jgi:hypothetical protein